jgi:hypothetical protein
VGKIVLSGFIKNNEETLIVNEKGLFKDNQLSFVLNKNNVTIYLHDKTILLKNDLGLNLKLNEIESELEYTVNNKKTYLNVKTKKLKLETNSLFLEYIIEDTNTFEIMLNWCKIN